jgi:hypothetical protein
MTPVGAKAPAFFMEMDMSEPQDDLTLVYMFGYKNGKDSMKAENKRLRAALQEIVEECQNDPIVIDRMIDRIEETARGALEGVKSDD